MKNKSDLSLETRELHELVRSQEERIEALEKNLRAARFLRDMRSSAYRSEKANLLTLVKSLRNEFDLWVSDCQPVERAIELLEEALGKQGDQHGASTVSREDQSNSGQGGNEVDEQGEKTNA